MNSDSDSDNDLQPVSQPPQPQTESTEPPPNPSTDPNPTDSDALETSFFPSPSLYYKRYTNTNLSLPPDTITKEGGGEGDGEGEEFNTNELKPPNVEWIVEDGRYSVFGESWPVEEASVRLRDMGVKELFDKEVDRSQSLSLLLQALLLSYSQLVSSLLSPPPSLLHRPPPPSNPDPNPSEEKTDPDKLVEHIRLIAINMHYLVNELRPVQARETLKNMMRTQIEVRRAKTMAIRSKCEEIKKTLVAVQEDLAKNSQSGVSTATRATRDEGMGVEEDGGKAESLKRDRILLMRVVDEYI